MGDEATVIELGERVAELARVDEDGDPLEPVEVVNFFSPLRWTPRQNPDADVEEIRATCKRYSLGTIDELIAYAHSGRR